MKVTDSVAEHHIFYLHGGTSVRSLRELAEKLESCTDADFAHHVNEFRHDFHNWVKDVYKDKKLATALLKAKTRKKVIVSINSRLEKATPKVATKERKLKREKKKEHKIKHTVTKAKDVMPTKLTTVKAAVAKKKTVKKKAVKKKAEPKKTESYEDYLAKIRKEFHDWASEVLQDKELADRLLATKSREEAEQIIEQSLNAKSKPIEKPMEIPAKQEQALQIKEPEVKTAPEEPMAKMAEEKMDIPEQMPPIESLPKPAEAPKQKKGLFSKLFKK